MKLDRRTLCVHEAGHTVIGRMFGLGCLGVLVDHPALEPRGLNAVSMVLPSKTARVQGMVAMGGFLAQLKLDPEDLEKAYNGSGAWFDGNGRLRFAEKTDWAEIERCTGGNDRLFATWGADVKGAFDDPEVWDRVEQVADLLCQRGRLSRDDVLALLP